MTLLVTGTVGAVTTVVGTMCALGLTRLTPRLAGAAMSLLSIPVMLPPLVLAVALSSYYSTVGIKLGLGPVIAGAIFDKWQTYEPLLWGLIAVFLVASGFFASLSKSWLRATAR